MIKYILIIILLFSTISYADTELTPQLLDAVNQRRMTVAEQLAVKRYVKRYRIKNKNKTEVRRFINAINDLSSRADYLAYNHNPSDVLTGYADCQGYSIMLYLLLSSVNIQCRVIYNETHMWNEVYLKGKWQKFDMVGYESLKLKIE
jgi:hypothetical protein